MQFKSQNTKLLVNDLEPREEQRLNFHRDLCAYHRYDKPLRVPGVKHKAVCHVQASIVM